jgi:hypothetical protein
MRPAFLQIKKPAAGGSGFIIAEYKSCYEPICLSVNTRIAIARQHMAMLEAENNIKKLYRNRGLEGNGIGA